MNQFIVSTLGWMPIGYGWEDDNNWFHDGTILKCCSAIQAQNPVYFGAGETIMAKTCFEGWLWDIACAKNKHIYSEKNIPPADFYQEDCAKKCQFQSFLGVVADHQNSHAEYVIQTIIYTTKTFMLLVSLHLSKYGVDDLVL